MILPIKYPVFSLSPENLSGNDLSVQAVSDGAGGTTTVTVASGDYVGVLTASPGAISLVIFEVVAGGPWIEVAKQPETGDVVIVTGTEVPFVFGSASVVNEDQALAPVNLGLITTFLGQLQNEIGQLQGLQGTIQELRAEIPPPAASVTWMAGEYELTSEIRVASCDTSEGDVIINLPEGDGGRVVFVSNRHGNGTVHLVCEGNSMHPAGPIGLGPSGRCVIASFGGGWDVKL